MLDSNNIERMAIHKIESFINVPFTCLQSNISKGDKGDKGVSFDGTIDVFISHQQNKANLIGNVPVQSKGKTVKKLSNKSYNFAVDTSDLHNYYKNDGVLYFCTQLTKTGESKSFYKMFLPLELKSILNGIGDKKTKTIKFNELKDDKHLSYICRQFLRERNSQPQSLVHDVVFYLENFKEHHFTIPTINTNSESLEDILDSIIDQPAYFYGRDNNVTYPIDVVTIESMSQTGICEMEIDNRIIEYNYELQFGKKEHKLILESSFIISFTLDSKATKFKIVKPTTLNLLSYKKILLLLRKLKIENELVFFNGAMILGTPKSTIFGKLERNIEEVNQIEVVFRKLGIPLESNLSDRLMSMFDSLIKIFIENDNSIIDFEQNSGSPSIIKLSITNEQKILLFYNEREKGEKDKFVNFFSEQILNRIVVREDTSEQSRVSLYSEYTPDELVQFINFNISIVLKSLEPPYHIVNSDTLNRSSHFGLECLRAFDKNPNPYLLEMAEKVFLEEVNSGLEDITFSRINLYQTKVRKGGNLEEEEIEILLNLKLEALLSHNYSTAAGCCILLGSTSEAKFYLTKVNQEDREAFLNFPIYHLLIKSEEMLT